MSEKSKGVLFEFEIIPDGGQPYVLQARSRDVSRWESLPGKLPDGSMRSMAAVGRVGSMRVLEEVAHCAAVRQGLFDGNLAAFRESCDIDTLDDDEDDEVDAGTESPDPTQPDR